MNFTQKKKLVKVEGGNMPLLSLSDTVDGLNKINSRTKCPKSHAHTCTYFQRHKYNISPNQGVGT